MGLQQIGGSQEGGGGSGEQGEIGYPGFKYDVRRVAANGVPYLPGEIVEYQGSYYICVNQNDAIIPTSTLYWAPYSFVGEDGAPGDDGKSAYQSYLDTTTDDPPLSESAWSQSGGGGDGGGGDYLPLAGGTMDANATITWGNASAIREAGAQGLEIECSVGYRWQFVAGRMILRQINSGQIQRVLAIDGVTPGDTEDISEGFIVGTRWETQDGTIYECTDSTDGSAVWVDVTLLPIPTPGIAYVNSGGNDTSGAIGNPGLPYLTAQAAWDDGARNLDLGVGSYTITHVSSESDASLDVFFRGAGKEHTTLDFTFTGLNGDNGVEQTDPGQTGNPGTSGGNAGAFTLSSDKSLSINLVAKGGTGGNGGKGGPGSADPEIVGGNGGYGGNAGNGPTYEVFNCVLASLSKETDPGQGGPPGDDGGFGTGGQGASGTSGVGVTDHYYWCDINSFGNNVASANMDACLRDDRLFVNVPSNRVEYGAGFVEEALDVLYGERVETYRIESLNWETSSSTVADVPNLACVIAPSEQLTIEIFGFHTAGTGGMKVCFTGPGSPNFVRYNFHHWTTVTAVRSPIPGAATAFGVDLTEGAGSAVVMPFHVLLTVKAGAAGGPIQFKAASVTGGQTLTLMRETVMRVTR